MLLFRAKGRLEVSISVGKSRPLLGKFKVCRRWIFPGSRHGRAGWQSLVTKVQIENLVVGWYHTNLLN